MDRQLSECCLIAQVLQCTGFHGCLQSQELQRDFAHANHIISKENDTWQIKRY